MRGAEGGTVSADPCLECEERPALPHELYCEDCAQSRAERAAERALEGEPGVSVRELYERAWTERRKFRGY